MVRLLTPPSLAPLIPEGLGRPHDWVIRKRIYYLPVGVGLHKGELDFRRAPIGNGCRRLHQLLACGANRAAWSAFPIAS